jgi:hypothetical protein
MKTKYLLLLLLILPVLNSCKKDDDDYRKLIVGCWEDTGLLSHISRERHSIRFHDNGTYYYYLRYNDEDPWKLISNNNNYKIENSLLYLNEANMGPNPHRIIKLTRNKLIFTTPRLSGEEDERRWKKQSCNNLN